MSSRQNGKRRYVPGLSGPHFLRQPSMTKLLQFWYAMHARGNAARLPAEVCARCGKPGDDLVLHYTGARQRPKSKRAPNWKAAINDGLPDTFEVWCRSCVNQASAKKVPSRVRSERAHRGYKARVANQAGASAATGVRATKASNGAAGPTSLPPDAPKMIGGVAVVEAEPKYRFENGKMVMPPERDGWQVRLADGRHVVVRAAPAN